MGKRSIYLEKSGSRKRGRKAREAVLSCCGLLGLSFFFCWLEIGRFGIFGSSVDWISQHSVIPEYFRQQFYATGELFPEFAMGLGGGQNIYHFSYYGLYSPLILPSYLLPSVRMGDYLMAVSMLGTAASAVLFYGWQRSQEKPWGTCFLASLMLILSGPMIFQSARQVMFVNYIPFLCMALWGVDRYLRRGKPGVYLLGVFLMIMTSFYYSIGGMFVLVIYGMHRYLLLWEHPEIISAETIFFRQSVPTKKVGRHSLGIGKIRDAVWFLLPMLAAVFLGGFFLVPTAAALAGNRGGGTWTAAVSLFLPELTWFRHLYSAYGVGLTTFLLTVLLSGLFRRERSSRVLAWSSLAVLLCPLFMWLLNGGLYVREKALIPFLPLFCYLAADYCTQVEEEGRDKGDRCAAGNIRRSILFGCLPYAATCALLYLESSCGAEDFLKKMGQLPEKLRQGSRLALADRWELILLDGVLMLVWYLLCQMIWRIRRKRNGGMLLVLPVLFLALFGTSFRDTLHVESREFYEQVNEKDIGKAVEKVLALDDGFFRIEQLGSSAQQAANINRVWNAGQYISSIYSSSYNGAYQDFRMKTFDVEEPAGNFMMQRSSSNPVFQRMMGVRYLIKVWEDEEMAADEENSPPGYEWYLKEGCATVYKNSYTAPICYTTDRLITEEEYKTLKFPLNQMALERYAVRRDEKENGKQEIFAETKGRTYGTAEAERKRIEEVSLTLPVSEETEGRMEKTGDGYRICGEETWNLKAELTGEETEERRTSRDARKVLYLQFQVKNLEPGKSVSIWVNGMQNTLSSSASDYFYYNHNTTFTYAVPLKEKQKEVSIDLGKGNYEITDVRAFTADMDTECELYQSEFLPDWSGTCGNRISGHIDVRSTGYFVTSIPYDEGFEVRVDGKVCPIERVNTAFLGFPIKEGEHDVEITYHAPGAAAGRLVSILGLILTFCCQAYEKKLRWSFF